MQKKSILSLIGMSGAGKTSVGKSLAKTMNLSFLDSDDEIARIAGVQNPREIFATQGEAAFRSLEKVALKQIVEENDFTVLATGGGALMTPPNADLIFEKTFTIWLKVSEETLWQRLQKEMDSRFMLETETPRATLRALLHKREPVFAGADLVINADQLSIEESAEEIASEIRNRDDINPDIFSGTQT